MCDLVWLRGSWAWDWAVLSLLQQHRNPIFNGASFETRDSLRMRLHASLSWGLSAIACGGSQFLCTWVACFECFLDFLVPLPPTVCHRYLVESRHWIFFFPVRGLWIPRFLCRCHSLPYCCRYVGCSAVSGSVVDAERRLTWPEPCAKEDKSLTTSTTVVVSCFRLMGAE